MPTRRTGARGWRVLAALLDRGERGELEAEVDLLARGRVVADDLESLYATAYALFQVGGDPWCAWREQGVVVLMAAQEADGSWAPPANGSRVEATALGTLGLEVFYRYDREGRR